MQISTSLFYDRAASSMTALTAKADTLNTQVSTGKRLLDASDDAVAYQRLAGLTRAGADDTAYGANLTLAGSLLAQADTTLSSMTDQLQRASELIVQAGNGVMSPANLKSIGQELSGIVDTLAQLANTKDARGQSLFGQSDGAAGATKQADGHYVLASGATASIPIGDGQGIQPSETAARIFAFTGSAGATDTLTMLADLAATLQSGAPVGDAVSRATTDIQAASAQVDAVQGSLGARAARVDLESGRLKEVASDREATRSGIEDTDVTVAITDLQKTMTLLSATQASFGKLSGLSLFDYLR